MKRPIYVAPSSADVERRPCTCHPDDNPPVPCPRMYALQDCRRAAALAAEIESLRARLAEAAQTEERLRRGLQFYADGSHYEFGDPADWDSVSGEPSNFLCDEHGSTIEDGSVAKRILEGANIGPDDDGEFVFIDAPRPADSATVGQDCQTLASLDSEDAARFRWLCDDHADKAIRHLRDSLLERMSVMSLSAVRAAISIHLSNVSEQAKNSHHE